VRSSRSKRASSERSLRRCWRMWSC
jgi:hypothetical protein